MARTQTGAKLAPEKLTVEEQLQILNERIDALEEFNLALMTSLAEVESKGVIQDEEGKPVFLLPEGEFLGRKFE